MDQIQLREEINRLDQEINDLTSRARAGDPQAIAQVQQAEQRLKELIPQRTYYPGMFKAIADRLREEGY